METRGNGRKNIIYNLRYAVTLRHLTGDCGYVAMKIWDKCECWIRKAVGGTGMIEFKVPSQNLAGNNQESEEKLQLG
jgi:hypothetical protein